MQPLDELIRRQDWSSRLIQTKEFRHVPDVLGEHVVIPTREHRNRACAQPPQLIQPGGIFQYIDGFELDRTDREKLFEFQAARSPRLPENLQCDRVHPRLPQFLM